MPGFTRCAAFFRFYFTVAVSIHFLHALGGFGVIGQPLFAAGLSFRIIHFAVFIGVEVFLTILTPFVARFTALAAFNFSIAILVHPLHGLGVLFQPAFTTEVGTGALASLRSGAILPIAALSAAWSRGIVIAVAAVCSVRTCTGPALRSGTIFPVGAAPTTGSRGIIVAVAMDTASLVLLSAATRTGTLALAPLCKGRNFRPDHDTESKNDTCDASRNQCFRRLVHNVLL